MHQLDPVGSFGRKSDPLEPFEPACGVSADTFDSVEFDDAVAVPGCFCSYFAYAAWSAEAWAGHRFELVRIGVRFITTSVSGEELASWAIVAQLACRNSGRKSPLASWTENSVRTSWSSQASHHR